MASAIAAHGNRISALLKDRGATARSALAASWSRSLVQYGLDPDRSQSPYQLDYDAFRQAFEREAPMVRSAQETLDRLFQSVADMGCCIVLSNCDGVILDRRVSSREHAVFHDLRPGVVWSEASAGTNGVGTSLTEGRPLTIHRDQHFMARHIGMSCTAAPIRDGQGRIAGALDVSVASNALTRPILRLIATAACDAAQKIEARYFRDSFHGARIVLLPDAHAGAAIAIDRHDLVIGANYAARRSYGLTDRDLARPFPASRLLSPIEAAADGLEAAEQGAIRRALSRTGGNISEAARLLGISRATLHRKLARFGIGRAEKAP
jgi:transcriptional regulator of acetoin/glycerol metabolism